LLEVSNRSRYDGASVDQPSLVIKSASKADTGRYSCVLENQIGAAESQNAAQLNVLCKLYFDKILSFQLQRFIK
jgi:hypothetical protein